MTKKLPRVLIVEDEAPIAELVAVNLRHNGFVPIWAEDGESAQRELDAVLPDVILLDWMLPGTSGLQLARRWRADARTKGVPILMLTARGDEPDKVAGLDAGADDYVTKPFRLAELLARVRALLRRTHGEVEAEDEIRAQDVRVDVAAHRAFQAERELHLTAKEFDLLRVLVGAAGTVVARETLMREVWGSDPTGSTKTLDMHVSWLRRKLGDDASAPRYISTVRGMGFRFESGEGTRG